MANINNCNNNLKIYYQNVRGLRTKTDIFYRQMCLSSYDIVVLTETWMTDGIHDSEIFDDRYIVWRRDRDYSLTGQKKGGGVLIATRNYLPVTLKPLYNSTAEDLWLHICIKQPNSRTSTNIYIGVIYLCQQNLGLTFNSQLSNFLTKLNTVVTQNNDDKILVFGDFNLSGITWVPTNNFSLCPTNISSCEEYLLTDELNILNLYQYNGIVNKYGRILDLVISNDYTRVIECLETLVPIDLHHPALLIFTDLVQPPTLNYAPRIRYKFDKGDYDAINEKINSIDWHKEFFKRSMDESVSFFNETVSYLHLNHIPVKKIYNNSYPFWFNQSLIKSIKEKYKYWNKFNKYGNLSDRLTFIHLRERVTRLEATCYENYIQRTEMSIKNNPNYFWTFVKSRSKSQAMPSSMHYNNYTFCDGISICNAFSSYFHSTFLNSPDSNINPSPNISAFIDSSPISSNICKILVNEKEIEILLKKLDTKKGAGPDNISAVFLVNCASSICVPISLLFKKSLSTCTVPLIWKSAFITPVHKKGSKSEISNYRPISKLCIIAKLFERIIYNQVYFALKKSLNQNQHGFLKGRSTVSNLIIFNDFITEAMDKGHQVDVVYTDYSKAFDKIDHNILLLKLFKSGIHGDLLRWFSSYIDNRSQAVVLHNYSSNWTRVLSGIPQGSLIGPLLFNIYVNDIESCLQTSNLLCFADDMKIYSSISSPEDVAAFQADLNRLESYCLSNKLELNTSKCSVLTFTRKFTYIPTKYTLLGQHLSRKESIRDLGVYHDSKLIFEVQINDIVNKASKSLGFIMRMSKHFTEAKTLKILYCTFVRTHLEYASQIWNPCYIKYIDRIESIQKRFFKYFCFRFKIPYYSYTYADLCKKLHFLPLVNRREIADYIFLLKLLHNHIDCSPLLNKLKFKIPTIFSRHSGPLYVPKVSTNYRQNTYLLRACETFNKVSKKLKIDPFNTSISRARKCLSSNFFNKQ